ncbi:MAG: fibrobacter succinogenes major paralogous domain-containing protein [Bacteroidia bacterium]
MKSYINKLGSFKNNVSKSKMWFCSLIALAVLFVFAVSCSTVDDTPELTAPLITTDTIFETTDVSAVLGGKITSDGGSPVTSKGVCWSINQDPTMSNDTLMLGKGDKAFTASIKGLTKNTKYYVRAFATNGIGTTYGTQKSFTTGIIVDLDGNEYHYITIGSQVWMLENLKTTRFRNGEKIPFVDIDATWAKLTTPAFAYPNNLLANLALHGRLYNWYAANDGRNIAPKGWHVPTDVDFAALGDFLLGASGAGGKMKEAGLNNWDGPNKNADNSSGFTARGSGERDMDGTYKEYKSSAFFWSATPKDAAYGTAWYVTKDLGSLLYKAYDKKIGFTIRCIKN